MLDTAWVRFFYDIMREKIPLNTAGVAQELRKVESDSQCWKEISFENWLLEKNVQI